MKRIDTSKLKELLNGGVVSFSFEKKNGDLREAVGTTNTNNIPVANLAKGGSTPGDKVPYFDLIKGGWRSVAIDQPIYV